MLMSKFHGIKRGVRVKQGQTINVGSTVNQRDHICIMSLLLIKSNATLKLPSVKFQRKKRYLKPKK